MMALILYSVKKASVLGWTEEQKKRAMATSIQTVRKEFRVDELIKAGYSPTFAKYISVEERSVYDSY